MTVVLDTNVVVSALIFRQGTLVRLRELWQTGAIRPLVDRSCMDELLRVLAYPKFGLAADDISALLEDYLPFTTTVPPRRVRVPVCSDADDRKFLVLAASGRADVLVTGDRALRGVSRRVPFAIETPAAFLARFVSD